MGNLLSFAPVEDDDGQQENQHVPELFDLSMTPTILVVDPSAEQHDDFEGSGATQGNPTAYAERDADACWTLAELQRDNDALRQRLRELEARPRVDRIEGSRSESELKSRQGQGQGRSPSWSSVQCTRCGLSVVYMNTHDSGGPQPPQQASHGIISIPMTGNGGKTSIHLTASAQSSSTPATPAVPAVPAAPAAPSSPDPQTSAAASIGSGGCTCTCVCGNAAPPHKGGWVVDKSAAEFVALDPELKAQMRGEKQKRLTQVVKEMAFIQDSDDPTELPGRWACCGQEHHRSPCM